MSRYQLNPEAAQLTLQLLNEGMSIRNIFYELKDKNLFRLKEGTFRTRIHEQFDKQIIDDIVKWKLKSPHQQQSLLKVIDQQLYLDIKESIKEEETDHTQHQSLENNVSNYEKDVAKLLDALGEHSKDDLPGSNPSISTEQTLQNVEGALYKINRLEDKVNKMDRLMQDLLKENAGKKDIVKKGILEITAILNEIYSGL